MAASLHLPRLQIGEVELDLAALRQAYRQPVRVEFTPSALARVHAAHDAVLALADRDVAAYGINTGFGLLAQTPIAPAQRRRLQRNIILSHSAGVGALLDDSIVRLAMVLKLASLARGFSGVSEDALRCLARFLELEIYPCVPAQGSVGASGDLAPLAHLSLPLIGEGCVRQHGQVSRSRDGMLAHDMQPLELGPKEGLALLNGTQFSTAIALAALFEAESLLTAGLITGALSVDALKGSDVPFDERIQRTRGHRGQGIVARILRQLLAGSEIRASHRDCSRVQDPYSLRCQPQVVGACLDLLERTANTLVIEANAVTDNPLVFCGTREILSGGNFHAEPVAFAADILVLASAEIASIAERRLALLVDPKMSGLPAFLTSESGLNSGFMIPQVTAAALVAENRMMCHPASVDSIPTSANQEDHVSMATHGARRTLQVTLNAQQVVAIEFLAACQGIDFHAPLPTSPLLQEAHAALRARIPFVQRDRIMADEIAIAHEVACSPSVQALIDSIL